MVGIWVKKWARTIWRLILLRDMRCGFSGEACDCGSSMAGAFEIRTRSGGSCRIGGMCLCRRKLRCDGGAGLRMAGPHGGGSACRRRWKILTGLKRSVAWRWRRCVRVLIQRCGRTEWTGLDNHSTWSPKAARMSPGLLSAGAVGGG
ncbi:unnamed protein product [Microthlaspi erraticum]|uniref:Uncharacterized protein n=1 Tax=Microthlaspi erraticum TaxID=1685480 RepID=A0A6D2J7S9_9BRAS|nr:unnamed protein product [Microthlaspi erraticum]